MMPDSRRALKPRVSERLVRKTLNREQPEAAESSDGCGDEIYPRPAFSRVWECLTQAREPSQV